MRNLIHEKLAQSARFAPGKNSGGKDNKEQHDHDQPLTKILTKEEDHARRSAQEKSVNQINQHREEIKEGLTELINKYEGRQQELQKELSEIRELKEKIEALPQEISAEEIKDCKQLLQAADYKFLQHESEIVERNTDSKSTDSAHQSLTDASFFQLTRTGLALTWPLILAIIGAFTTLGLLMYSLFAIQ